MQNTLPSAGPVEDELVRMLYQHTWIMSLAIGVTGSSFTAWMFRDTVPTAWLIAWFIAINSIVLLRVASMVAFRQRPPAAAALARWGRFQVAAVWINGLVWGLPALALTSDNLILTFFYATLLCGFVAGAMPGLSYSVPAYAGFAVLTGAPLIGRLVSFEDPVFRLIAILAVLFVAINIASVRIGNRRIREQIRLQLANRQLVQDLIVEKERAERADAVKSQFLAAASHDLRQPLHALGLFVDALDARTTDPELRGLIGNIQLSTTSLRDLLDALLDISRLDAGVTQPVLTTFPLGTLLANLVVELEPEAAEKGVELRLVQTSAWVTSDAIMLTRILLNVLANALHHAAPGSILVGCRRRGGAIRIEVHDTGPGMRADQLARVFDEFYQVGNPQRDRRHGLGLGLAIVRRLGTLLGHEFTLRSEPGRGTTFCIEVPAEAPQPALAMPHAPALDLLANIRVLVIENEEAVREAMRATVESWQCVVTLAESCDAALRKLEEHGHRPDLILTDYHLAPDLNGAEAAEQLRARYGPVPAIIVTGDTAIERVAELRERGFEVLHKPVSAARLRSLASHLLRAAALNR